MKRFMNEAMSLRAEVSTVEQLNEALTIDDLEYIYAPIELITTNNERIIAIPPVFIGGREREIIESLRGFKSALAHTLGHIELIKNAGLQIHGGFRLNITNSLSLKQYEKLGLIDGLYSVELSLKRISAMKPAIPMGILAYGHVPLMILRRCPVKDEKLCGKAAGFVYGCSHLKDRLGNKLQTSCRFNEVEVLNPVPLNLSNKKLDIDFVVLKIMNTENIADVLHNFKNGINLTGKFTRGLYFK